MGDYQLKIGLQTFDVEVKGSEDFSETIVRDFTDKLLRIRGNYQFTGYQGLYDVLYNNIISEGVCNSLEGKVYYRGDDTEPYVEVWRGELKPQDIEFDLIKYSAGTQILDNSWSGKFNNSQDQKVTLRSNTSKNGNGIPSCPIQNTTFYDPTDGSTLGDTRNTYKLFDVFTFLVNYYTDNTVTFTSTYLDTGGEGRQYHLTTGKELRTYDGTVNPDVSFSEVFTEMNKKLNLWIIIEGTLESPVLRIEPTGYSLEESVAIEVQNPESILLKTDLEQLYTVIKVGSNQTDYDPDTYANYPNGNFYAWNEEEYNTTGDCEFENSTLDLVSDWKIDSNSIEQALSVSVVNEDFDSDIFIVEVDDSGNAYKYNSNVTEGSTNVDYFYNFNLTNEQVIFNWFESIPAVIQKDLFGDLYVYVDQPTLQNVITKFHDIDFSNDSSPPGADPENIYNTTNSQFKALTAGFYNTYGSVSIDNRIGLNTFTLVATVYEDTTRTDIVSQTVLDQQEVFPVGSGTSTATLQGTENIFMFDENVMVIRMKIKFTGIFNYDITAGTATITTSPINYAPPNDDPLIYLYDIQRFKLSDTDYNTLKTNKTQQIRFIDTLTQRTWQVWPKEMTWNRERQIVTSGEFIGRAPTNALCWVLEGGIWDDACYWIDSKSWIDCGTQVIESSDFTGNPLSGWTLGGTTTQTGVGTFQDSGGGPLYQVTFTQSITLTAGSYTLFYDFSISGTPNWNGAFSLTNSDIPATSWVGSTNTQESGSIDFTVTGSSSRTLSLTFDTFAVNPTFTTTLLNICA